MKILGFAVYHCKVDRKQQLSKQTQDGSIQQSSSDSSESDKSSTNVSTDSKSASDESDHSSENDSFHEPINYDTDESIDEVDRSFQGTTINDSTLEHVETCSSDSEVSSEEEMDEDDNFVLRDKDGNIIFSTGKDGNMSSARFGSRNMYACSVFSQRTLIKKFAKLFPDCKSIQKVVKLIDTKSFKRKCKSFVKFSIIHLNYFALDNISLVFNLSMFFYF